MRPVLRCGMSRGAQANSLSSEPKNSASDDTARCIRTIDSQEHYGIIMLSGVLGLKNIE